MDVSKGDQITVKMSHVDEEFGTVGYPVDFDDYADYDGRDIHIAGAFVGEIHLVKIRYGSDRVWVGKIQETLRKKQDHDRKNSLRGTALTVEVDRVSNSGNTIAYPVEDGHDDLEIHVPFGEPGEKLEVKVLTVNGDWAKSKLSKRERAERRERRKERRKKKEKQKRKKLRKRQSKIEEEREKAAEQNEKFREELGREVLEEALSLDEEVEGVRTAEDEEEWKDRTKETMADLNEDSL